MIPGSVNGGNSAELAKEEDIDGFLVGGASLKVYTLQLFTLKFQRYRLRLACGSEPFSIIYI